MSEFGPPPEEIRFRQRRTRGQRVLTQTDVEDEIQKLSADYEAMTEELDRIGREAANAEADWKFGFWRAMLTVTDERPKSNAEWREAKSSLTAGESLYRAYRVTAATERAVQEKCRSLKTRLSALQTISSNLRAQT